MEYFILNTNDFESKNRLYSYLKSINGTFKVQIEPKSETRSHNQNRYYHGVVLKMIAEEIGEHPNAVHELMKEKFLVGVESTKELNTIDFESYLKSIVHWSADFLSLVIPSPNEV